MPKVRVTKHIDNREIVSKIMDSVARKYDCAVEYDSETEMTTFTGDQRYKTAIAEEVAEILFKKR